MTQKIDPTAMLKTVQDAMDQGRATVESFTKASSDAAHQNYDKIVSATQAQLQKATVEAQKSYDELTKLQRETVSTVTETGTLIAKGAEEVSKRTATFAQANMEAAIAHAKSLTAAKTVNDLVDLHANYLRASYERAVAEANSMQTLSVKLANEVFAPLKTKADAVVQKFTKAA